MKTLTSTAIALILCLAAGTASAQPPMGSGGMGPGHMGPGPMMAPDAGAPGAQGDEFPGEPGRLLRFLDRLDLSDDQWDQIEDIMDDTRDQIEEIREEMRPEEPLVAFLTAFSSSDLSVTDLEAITDDMDTMRESIREVALEGIVRVHDVLTADQLAEVAELAEDGLPVGPCGGGMGFGPGCGR